MFWEKAEGKRRKRCGACVRARRRFGSFGNVVGPFEKPPYLHLSNYPLDRSKTRHFMLPTLPRTFNKCATALPPALPSPSLSLTKLELSPPSNNSHNLAFLLLLPPSSSSPGFSLVAPPPPPPPTSPLVCSRERKECGERTREATQPANRPANQLIKERDPALDQFVFFRSSEGFGREGRERENVERWSDATSGPTDKGKKEGTDACWTLVFTSRHFSAAKCTALATNKS